MDIGAAVGRKDGISEEKLIALIDFEQSNVYSDREMVALRYTVAMTQTPQKVSDELFAQLQEHFSKKQLVELTAAIAWENYRARFNHAFAIESAGFTEGAVCKVPEYRPVQAKALSAEASKSA